MHRMQTTQSPISLSQRHCEPLYEAMVSKNRMMPKDIKETIVARKARIMQYRVERIMFPMVRAGLNCS